MRRRHEPLVRTALVGLATGAAGTTAMTVTTRLEKALRGERAIPVDYDATDHVVTAAATVLRTQPRTDTQRRLLFALVHWGYGSAVAAAHRGLRRQGMSRVQAAGAFYAGCQAMAFALFPTLGGTPAPWRWRRDVLASSLAQHLVYVTAVAVTDRVLDERAG